MFARQRAFNNHTYFVDGVRVVLIVAGVILFFWIARVVRESWIRDELGPGQMKRYGALAGLDIADVFGSGHSLGRGAYWTLWLALISLILAWWGVVDERNDQRKNNLSKAER